MILLIIRPTPGSLILSLLLTLTRTRRRPSTSSTRKIAQKGRNILIQIPAQGMSRFRPLQPRGRGSRGSVRRRGTRIPQHSSKHLLINDAAAPAHILQQRQRGISVAQHGLENGFVHRVVDVTPLAVIGDGVVFVVIIIVGLPRVFVVDVVIVLLFALRVSRTSIAVIHFVCDGFFVQSCSRRRVRQPPRSPQLFELERQPIYEALRALRIAKHIRLLVRARERHDPLVPADVAADAGLGEQRVPRGPQRAMGVGVLEEGAAAGQVVDGHEAVADADHGREEHGVGELGGRRVTDERHDLEGD
ncbi:hypothetical protein JOL62DRAFT_587924 [Phyllosticta paracitricarpa]|uniref:Uncharacterized protein n=1 Tax=Phyllosticta paracitricarpa TaxID=2016321 RepID=A0ABR1MT76_9PEZI